MSQQSHLHAAPHIHPLASDSTANQAWLGYDVLILVVSLLAMASLACVTLLNPSEQAVHVLETADFAVCILFLADFVVSLVRAENKLAYLLSWGWLDLLSSLPAVAVARWGRAARVIRLLRLLRGFRATKILVTLVLRHQARNAVLAAGLVAALAIFAASLAVLHFETTEDSNITSAEDAMWWAFTTVTTVGYGDHFPVTTEGRLVAAALMAVGVAVFGTIAGGLASWFSHPSEAHTQAAQPTNLDLQREISELRQVVLRDRGGPLVPGAEQTPVHGEITERALG